MDHKDPSAPATLNDVRVTDESLDSVATDLANPRWAEAIEFILAHPLFQAGPALDEGAKLELMQEVQSVFDVQIEEASDMVDAAMDMTENGGLGKEEPTDLVEAAAQPSDSLSNQRGDEGKFQGHRCDPSKRYCPLCDKGPDAAASGQVIDVPVDMTKEYDSEQDMIDDLNVQFGTYQKDWDFAEGPEWALTDKGTIKVKLLKRTAAPVMERPTEVAPETEQVSDSIPAKAIEVLVEADGHSGLYKWTDGLAALKAIPAAERTGAVIERGQFLKEVTSPSTTTDVVLNGETGDLEIVTQWDFVNAGLEGDGTVVQRELDPEDLETLEALVNSKFGWAVAQQFTNIMEGEVLDNQNSNALGYIADFLEKRREEGASEVAQELRAYLGKHGGASSEEDIDHVEAAEAVEAGPPGPRIREPRLPEQMDPNLQEMAQRRIDLQKKLDAIDDQVNALQQALSMAVEKEKDVVQQEEPALQAMLEKLPKYRAIIDGWQVILSTRKASERIKYKDVLDYVEDKSKAIAPNIAKLIAQLKGMDNYLTKIPESKSIDLKREESLLAAGGWKETLQKFKGWLSSVFAPLATSLDQQFAELEDQMAIVQTQGA